MSHPAHASLHLANIERTCAADKLEQLLARRFVADTKAAIAKGEADRKAASTSTRYFQVTAPADRHLARRAADARAVRKMFPAKAAQQLAAEWDQILDALADPAVTLGPEEFGTLFRVRVQMIEHGIAIDRAADVLILCLARQARDTLDEFVEDAEDADGERCVADEEEDRADDEPQDGSEEEPLDCWDRTAGTYAAAEFRRLMLQLKRSHFYDPDVNRALSGAMRGELSSQYHAT